MSFYNCHPISCQGSSFVRTNGRGIAHSLARIQMSNQVIILFEYERVSDQF